MPEFISRDQWGARDPRSGPGTLDRAKVRGIALHWPGITTPIRGIANVKRALRAWQDFHMDDRGWSDLAYQQIVDQDGNRYQGRGLGVQSGANGDEFVNENFGALLLILAPGERPSPAMVKAVHRVIRRHRALYANSGQIVGHNQVRPGGTTCPGPIVSGSITDGVFEPPKPWTTTVLRRRVTRALAEAEEAPDKTPGIAKTRARLERVLAWTEREM